VAHEFLSDEWMDAVEEIRARHAGDANPVAYQIRMNQVITDVPFTSEPIHLHVDTTDGTMKMGKGDLDEPEVTVTTDWQTARTIFVDGDQAAAMQAFMAGKIRVEGDMTKLMLMNAAPPDDAARAVAAEIKEITS
jgi:hypothetical protein